MQIPNNNLSDSDWAIELFRVVDSVPGSPDIKILTPSGRTFQNPYIVKGFVDAPGVGGVFIKPPIDSFGIIAYSKNNLSNVGYVLGFIDLTLVNEDKTLDWGDFLFKQNNKLNTYFLFKNNGIIEMVSNEQLYTKMSPNKNSLSNMCENFSLISNGGKIEWKETNEDTHSTTFTAYFRDSINDAIANKVTMKIGSIDNKNVMILNINDKWKIVAGVDGAFSMGLNETDFMFMVDPKGNCVLGVGTGTFTLDIKNPNKSILLGSPNAKESFILGDKFLTDFQTLLSALGSVVGIGNLGIPVPPSPGLINAVATMTANLPLYKSLKIKGE